MGGGAAAFGADSTLGYATVSPAAFIATRRGKLPPRTAWTNGSAVSTGAAGTIRDDSAGCNLGVGCVELGGEESVPGSTVLSASRLANMSAAGAGKYGYGSCSPDHRGRATGARADWIPLGSPGWSAERISLTSPVAVPAGTDGTSGGTSVCAASSSTRT